MPEEKETCMNSYDLPISLQDKLKRVDEIHRAITRAVGRIEYLKLSALRAGSRRPLCATGAAWNEAAWSTRCWKATPSAGASANCKRSWRRCWRTFARWWRGCPPECCGPWPPSAFWRASPAASSAGGMHFSRCYVYRLLVRPVTGLCQMEEARLGLKKNEK